MDIQNMIIQKIAMIIMRMIHEITVQAVINPWFLCLPFLGAQQNRKKVTNQVRVVRHKSVKRQATGHLMTDEIHLLEPGPR